MAKITRDKIAGALYGVAFGDAMGRNTEFTYDVKKIYERFGYSGRMDLPYPALFTDDTQMTLAVARALGEARSITPLELSRTLRAEFIRWSIVDPRRAPGVTCMTAVTGLRRGVRWQDATVARSKGCGANMRVAPTAFLADLDDALGASQLQGAMTHGHPVAIAATELTALAIRWAAEDVGLGELPEQLWFHGRRNRETYNSEWLGKLGGRRWPRLRLDMRDGWDTATRIMLDVDNAYRQRIEGDACRALGGGWIAEEALATGLFYAMRWRNDPVRAVSEAARTSGDSDSIASIAGAIVGAAHGIAAWPRDWIARIERRADIEQAIDITYARSQ